MHAGSAIRARVELRRQSTIKNQNFSLILHLSIVANVTGTLHRLKMVNLFLQLLGIKNREKYAFCVVPTYKYICT
jgi:hypothetical protein